MATAKPKESETPLHELERDPLSVFLFICFTGKELGELIAELGISIPGFRTERLSDAERADAIADEIRAVPSTAKPVLALMQKIYEFPALDFVALTKEVGLELAALSFEEDAPVRILWRLLSDPAKEVRATALPALEKFVDAFYGEPEEGAAPIKAPPSKTREGGGEAEMAKLRKSAARAQEETAALKARAEELKEELRAARAAASEAQRAASAAKKAREAAEKKAAKPAPAARPGAGAAKQTQKALESAKHDLAAAQERTRAAEAEGEALRAELAALQTRAAVAPAGAAEEEEGAVEALPATWLMPRFTREFYDSLKGWEPRIVRTVFKQAFLLAENHRHPSLRAIPLQGVPGFYRVRVATDVRLIYKRVENEVEILSVIDREDLDRYVREAKTR